MKTFKDLVFKKHKYFPNGTQARLDFSNGYGISVVTGEGAYQSDGNYEVAVMKGRGLCYDTPITDDAIGHQTEEHVTEIMAKIQALPKGN